MIVDSPDQVLWRYLALKEQLGSPATRSPVIDRGLVFGDECVHCSADVEDAKLEERDKKTGASRWVCSRCHAAWPVDVAFLLRNEFQSSRRPNGASAEKLSQLATLGSVLDGLLLREQRIYLLLYLYEGVGSYDDVAAEANKRWPTFHPPYGTRGPRPQRWTEWAVRKVVTEARKRVMENVRSRAIGPRYA